MVSLPDSVLKVTAAASSLGLAVTVKITEESARTAEEAAAACNCDVAQIVKSLVFRGAKTGVPYLLLVSGKNRVDEKGVAEILGEPLRRPDAQDVRALTGFAIGGIPPFGHTEKLETLMDPDLLLHSVVWAAAGTPTAVFPIDPALLQHATAARMIKLSS